MTSKQIERARKIARVRKINRSIRRTERIQAAVVSALGLAVSWALWSTLFSGLFG